MRKKKAKVYIQKAQTTNKEKYKELLRMNGTEKFRFKKFRKIIAYK